MDLSSVLAYKSLFFFNRANKTSQQVQEGKKCTSVANAARCAITASQSIVPLYAVSRCLSESATNPILKETATKISNSNLQNIATSMTSSTTKSALNSIAKITGFLAKLGIIGNITYAVAKCLDADEKDKTKVFLQASGNCAGMYLFEHLYSKAVKNIQPQEIEKATTSIAKTIPVKLAALKAIKPLSIVLGLGFVIASLTGCWAGEKFGEQIYALSEPRKQPVPVHVNSQPTLNMVC